MTPEKIKQELYKQLDELGSRIEAFATVFGNLHRIYHPYDTNEGGGVIWKIPYAGKEYSLWEQKEFDLFLTSVRCAEYHMREALKETGNAKYYADKLPKGIFEYWSEK